MIQNNSIKVAIKIKPTQNVNQTIVKSHNTNSPSLQIQLGNEYKNFQVDYIYDANANHASMFENLHVNEFLDKFLDGFNATIMAYGHTGSGKTYCMEGANGENGIVIESMRKIFDNIKESASITCSYIQLYNEKILDLLSQDMSANENLKLRWEIERDFVVEGLSLHTAKNFKELEKLWRKGTKNRVVASNKVHDMSSRSHSLFFINLQDTDEENNLRNRQLTFVDLAGSERILTNDGKLSKESIEINKSLFVLRKVIKILEESTTLKKETYIPYRDSKLTSLLKGALGGNCLTMMIACIDSMPQHKEETLLTLSYAVSAGKIKNSARNNIDINVLENKRLKNENEKLRKELESAWKQIELNEKGEKESSQNSMKSMSEYSHKVIECIGTIRELIKSNKELREELDEERKIKRQLKIEIEMLMDDKYVNKKLSMNYEGNSSICSPTRAHEMRNFGSTSPNKEREKITAFYPKQGESSPRKLIRVREVIGSASSSPSKIRNVRSSGNNEKGYRNTNNNYRPKRSVPDLEN